MAISLEDAFDAPIYSINDTVVLAQHTSDPRVNPGFVAPIGSLLLDSVSGDLYNKFGLQSTDWNIMTVRNGRTIQFINGTVQPLMGTSLIPISSTLPSITEGSEIWSQVLTPSSVTNMISVSTNFSFAASASEMSAIACIFRNNTCISAILLEGSANPDVGRPVSFSCYDFPGVDGAAVTYSCRVGKMSGTGVWYVNSTQTYSNLFAGILCSDGYQIAEVTH